MEQVVPMDRLVCGDVGYGKTEIAVRAAFKAVQDGKQVAVLVPTTLLVQQHFSTFAERMAGFPVVLKGLSRFQTDKEATEVIEGLREGTVDIVIGTHRLLNPDIRIKNLGLIVVDEEQRFGVEHKEQMKRLRTSVDVLSMSATPIPRTLEMAITGIREMSTITTPPEERHPVLTYVGAYEDRQVAAAIRRELLREGQVFYIHNRVQSIDKAAARIRELVPEARVAVAHGQMGEHQLEQVMVDFWEKRFDVLVCTTIVESGLDVSNANTMMIERADMLGLSQLHQLRGRVGRGRERAYAYFLYPPDKPLTETAHERLATLAQHSDLGGGMAIAMKDLEIRGAGNLLGGEQSGHIADVGFDLYVRLVGEAVHEFRGDGRRRSRPRSRSSCRSTRTCRTTTCPSERLRLEMYKRLAEVRTDDDVTADPRGDARPVRRAAGAGGGAAGGGPVPGAGAECWPDRRDRAGQVRPVRAGRAARLRRRSPQPAAPRQHPQGRPAYDARAASLDGRRRWQPDPRRGVADVGASGCRHSGRPGWRRTGTGRGRGRGATSMIGW